MTEPGHSSLSARYFLTTILATVALISLGACSQIQKASLDNAESGSAGVTVDKAVPFVQTKVLPPAFKKAVSKNVLTQDVEGFTEWLFSCKAQFDTDVVNQDDTEGGATIALKIKDVKLKLALPIIEHMPVKASAELKAHEDGHVQICSLVYGNADKVAVAAGKAVIGTTYHGMGRTLVEAQEMAMLQPQKIISQIYQEGTTAVCDQASEKYDDYCHNKIDTAKYSREQLAQMAYDAIIGIQVKVIK